MARAPSLGAGQQASHPALIKRMHAASHGILAVEDHLGDLRDTHRLGGQQNDLASRLDRGIGSSMGKFLDHVLLSGLQIAHVDFTWPGYGSTSFIAFLVFHFTTFPAEVSPLYLDDQDFTVTKYRECPYNHPFCSAIRAASMRLRAPSFCMATER